MKDFLARIASVGQGPTPKSLTPDCVEFRDVSPENFNKIGKKAGQEGEAVGRFFYFADARLLIITLVTHPHEHLHLFIDCEVAGQARDMGIHKELGSVGTYKALGQAGSSGESDSNFFPELQRSAARGDWPSVVIEAGYSQTEKAARLRAERWLRQSNYIINLILLVRIELSQRMI